MHPRLLLDTHVLIRWLSEPRRLSKEQLRVLDAAEKHFEAVALSSMCPLEIGILAGDGRLELKKSLQEMFDDLQGNSRLHILPVTYEIAMQAGYLGSLRDPADRAIVATARVHGLRLVTSEQRIIESKFVPVIS